MPDRRPAGRTLLSELLADVARPAYLLDPRTLRFLDANAACCRFYGYSREEFLRLSLFDIRPGSGRAAVGRRVRRLPRFEVPYALRVRHVKKSGKPVDVQLIATPVRVKGRLAWMATVTDLQTVHRFEQERASTDPRARFLAESLPLLFQSSPQPMWVFDVKTLRFLAVNDAALRMYGYTAEEFRRMTVKAVRPREDVKRFLSTVHREAGKGVYHAGLWRHLRKNGELVEVQVVAHDIVFGGRQARLAMLTDVTRRAREEAELQRAKTIFESSADGISVTDMRGRFTGANAAFERLVGYSLDELRGRNFQEITAPEFRKAGDALLATMARGERAASFEKAYLRKDGTRVPVHVTVSRITDSRGNSTGFSTIVKDVTQRKKAEAALAEAEAALREREQRLSSVVSGAPIVLFAVDKRGVFTLSEGHALAALGLKPGQVVGRSIFSVYRGHPRILADARRALAGKSVSGRVEAQGRVFDTRWTPTRDAAGRLKGAIGVATDVTDGWRLERELRESRRAMQSVLDAVPDYIYSLDRQGRFLYLNRTIPGYPSLIGTPIYRMLKRSSPALWRAKIAEAFETGRAEFMTEGVDPRGNTSWFENRLQRASGGAHAQDSLVCVTVNVTARVELERQLRTNEEQLRSLYRATPAMMHSIDRDGRLVEVSDLWLETLGYRRDEVIGRRSTEFLTPESREYARKVVLPKFYETGRCVDVPYRFVTKDGRILDMLLSATVERAPDGAILRSRAVLNDVSEKVRAQGLLGLILENAPETIFTLDRRGRFTYINRARKGRDAESFLGRSILPVVQPQFRALWKRSLASVLRTGETAAFETFYDLDGVPTWFSNRLAPLREGGVVVGAVCVASDVTARKSLESELKASEAYWRGVLAQAPDFVTVLDRRLRIRYINRLAEGYELEKVIGASGLEFLAPAYQAEARRFYRRVLRTGRAETFELRAQGDDGRMTWYSTRVSPLRRKGRIEEIVLVSRDISEEKVLRGRFEGVFRSSRDAIDYVSLDGRLIDVNPAYEKLTGFTREELLEKKRIFELTPPEHHEMDRSAMARMLRSGEPVEFEKEYFHKSGRRVPVNCTAFPVRGPGGRVEGFAAIIKDISERRRLEREILEAGAREQSKLGRDLHDSLGQTITGISLLAKGLRARLSRHEAPETRDAMRLAELSSQAVQQVRGLARGLIPSQLQTAGLGEALDELTSSAETLFGIRCDLRYPKDLELPDEATAVQLYRIAQEAIHNAAKHAHARSAVRVSLTRTPNGVRLTVSDDGVGIPPEGRRAAGLGLGIMEHRARMLGGMLTIRRGPRGGTEVVCDCPLRSAALHSPRVYAIKP